MMCQEVMSTNVDKNNCIDLYEFSRVYSLRRLEVQCLNIIKNNFNYLVESSSSYQELIKELQEVLYIHFIHHMKNNSIMINSPRDHISFVLYHLNYASEQEMVDLRSYIVDLFINTENVCSYLKQSKNLELKHSSRYLLILIDDCYTFVTQTEDYKNLDPSLKNLIEQFKKDSIKEYFKRLKEKDNFSI